MITFIAYGLCLLLLEEAQWLQRVGEGRFELYGKACSKIRVAERTASLNWQRGGEKNIKWVPILLHFLLSLNKVLPIQTIQNAERKKASAVHLNADRA